MDVCARELGRRIASSSEKAVPLLLGLSLKDYSAETIKSAVELACSFRVW